MDLLQRLSFWQTNNTERMKTMAVEKEETIIKINQEKEEENRKETKTNIIITEIKLHLQTINVSININLKHLLVCVLYVSSVHYLYAQVQFIKNIQNVSQVGTHKPRYKVHQLLLLYSIISLHRRRFRFSYLFCLLVTFGLSRINKKS